MDNEEFRQYGHQVVDWIGGLSRRHPPVSGVARHAAGRLDGSLAHARARSRRTDGRDPRRFPALHRSRADALESSAVLRVLRYFGLAPGHSRRDAGGRAQCQRHAVEELPGAHRTRTSDARMAAPMDRPARRILRDHLRYGVHQHSARDSGGARNGRSGIPHARQCSRPGDVHLRTRTLVG